MKRCPECNAAAEWDEFGYFCNCGWEEEDPIELSGEDDDLGFDDLYDDNYDDPYEDDYYDEDGNFLAGTDDE
jgi:hypothetical protein